MYLRDNYGRATVAVVFLAAMILVQVFMAYYEYQYSNHLRELGYVPYDLDPLEIKLGVTALISVVLQIISAITFIMWFRRAYNNVRQMNKEVRYDEAWAAGAWFIPILCYIRPYQIMTEMKMVVNQKLSEHLKIDAKDNIIQPAWWLFWVLGSVLGAIAFRFDSYVDSIDGQVMIELLSAISSIILIPAGLLAISVVLNHAKKEKQLYEAYLLNDFDQNAEADMKQ